MWFFIWTFLLFTSSFAHFVIAAFDSTENAGNMGNLLFILCLFFCGILSTPDQFLGFWIFMYRVNPFTYLVSGMLSVGLANTDVTCAPNEYLHFDPVNRTNCGEYMEPYRLANGGYVQNALAAEGCSFCPMRNSNTYLATVSANYGDVWRNFELMWVYIAFNICAALGLYWWVRVPKRRDVKAQ